MFEIHGERFDIPFLLGTSLYPSLSIMEQAIIASKAEIITVSLRRQIQGGEKNPFWEIIKQLNKKILPNTAGCKTVKEAVTTAQMAREIFATNWVKLEVIGDDYLLQPEPFLLLEATKELIKQDFVVLPYCTYDLILCQHLIEAGCDTLLPWASPIGSGQGIMNAFALKTLRARLPDTTLIVDAGIGRPSDATKVLEMGYDGVLLNSAVALAENPVDMAKAFLLAIQAGALAKDAGIMPQREFAQASTPIIDTPFWHQEKQ